MIADGEKLRGRTRWSSFSCGRSEDIRQRLDERDCGNIASPCIFIYSESEGTDPTSTWSPDNPHSSPRTLISPSPPPPLAPTRPRPIPPRPPTRPRAIPSLAYKAHSDLLRLRYPTLRRTANHGRARQEVEREDGRTVRLHRLFPMTRSMWTMMIRKWGLVRA